ncbi:hypothetical protein, partial [Phyllobacterium chamaecytisi]|uniref:hypothetical protein n=1 Tax=Phyllobacterium chamaecytisi TaxID=2876082 RepID=UPI001CCCE001
LTGLLGGVYIPAQRGRGAAGGCRMRPIVWLAGLLAGWLIECLRLSLKETVTGSDILSGLTGRSGLFGRTFIGDGGFCAMVGSLTITYRRKRNVGGRVLRNIERCSTDTLADTFREKMLHASDRKVRCKVYICSRRFKWIEVSALIRSVTNIANIKFST